MRVRVVRTPGELRDTIGHKLIVRKDWEGVVIAELTGDEIADAGFHPKQHDKVYVVQFDEWEQPIAVPSNNLVSIAEPEERSA